MQRKFAYMVKVFALENSIPTLLVRKVLYDNNVKVIFPLGMKSEYIVAGCSSANGSGHSMAVSNESLDDV
jgi:hypothetical protein